MDDNTFTLRKNAARAAKALIAKGGAPGNQYTIEPAGDRFVIYWKPDEAAIAAAEDIAAEAAFYESLPAAGPETCPVCDKPVCECDDADQPPNPFPDGTLVVALGGNGMPGWHPATVLSRCATDGGAYWRVQFAAMDAPTLRQEPDMQIVTPERHAALIAELEGKKSRADKPAPKGRCGRAASAPAPGRHKETQADLDASNGKLPQRPEITSPTNQHVVGRFVKLEQLARDGFWGSVEAFEVKGVNTYAKKLARYRDQLLTARRVQQSQTEAAA